MFKSIVAVALLFVVAALLVVVLLRARKSANGPRGEVLTAKSGEIVFVDPKELFYSLATICDRLPPLEAESSRPNEFDLLVHDDDWRQIEFVAPNDRAYIAELIAKVSQFKTDHWVGDAWSKVFVRPDHPTALPSLQIRFSELQGEMPPSSQHDVFIFHSFGDPHGTARKVVKGFSFRVSPDLDIYGHEVDGIVASLAASVNVADESKVDAIAKSFESIRKVHPLILVDWNCCALVPLADSREVKRWLSFLGSDE